MLENKSPSPSAPSGWPRYSPGRLILLALALTVAWMWASQSMWGRPEEISYSELKAHITAGRVESIHIDGNEITGTLLAANEKSTPSTEAESDRVMPRVSGDEGETIAPVLEEGAFVSFKPPLEDPELMPLLEDADVKITSERVGSSGFWTAVLAFSPLLLLVGLFVFMSRRMQQAGQPGGLLGFGKSRAKRFERTASSVSFDDVAGLDNAKQDMREIVDFLRDPARYRAIGAKVPRGTLLMGPPGTGKTLLARAAAGEADVPFFATSGSEFIEMFVGVGASRVRDMFEEAKKAGPAIIFIDEIDSVGRARGAGLGGGHDEREQTLNQILSEMDGFSPHETVVVMAATNRPDVLDSALLRPGRFDRKVVLEMPRRSARQQILAIHARDVQMDASVDLDDVAASTVGFSGADLENLINEAAMNAARRRAEAVAAADVEEARDKIILGGKREALVSEEERRRVAVHESGHALLGRVLAGADRVRKVSIIPRGRAMGATEQVPDEERQSITRAELLDRITVMLGGRAAVQLVFDEVTTGADEDLKQATALARKMVSRWGMSELGPASFRLGEEHLFLGREMTQQRDFSEHTARLIDDAIRDTVSRMDERARHILAERRDELESLAGALLEHETLVEEEIHSITEAA